MKVKIKIEGVLTATVSGDNDETLINYSVTDYNVEIDATALMQHVAAFAQKAALLAEQMP